MAKPIPLLFLKAGIAHRQGLSLKPLVDSRGHPTQRWKRDEGDGDWRDEENWHTRTMKRMKTLSDESLRFILKDASDAAYVLESHGTESANRKAGQYRDEAHYASMELHRRRQAKMMIKSGIANQPGLSLQNVTDKGGHQTKRWKRSAQDTPTPKPARAPEATASQRDPDPQDKRGSARGYGTHDIQPGGRVRFKAGEHAGQGEIVAVGKDGVTVKDSEGREHGIHHHELTHYAPSPSQSGGDGGGSGKPPVTPGGEPEPEGAPKKPSTVLGKQDPIPAESFAAADYAKSHDQADVSVDSILAQFPPDTTARIKAAQDRLEGIEETIQEFKKDGHWTEDRRRIHDEIQDKILSDEVIKKAMPAPGEKPVFMILGGRGGSGKSSFAGRVYDPEKTIVLDADHIKGLLPEYEGWNAAQIHAESGEIFDKLVETARDMGLNLVLDKTMKTAKSAVADVQAFKDAGYRTEAHYMHLPRQEAAKRAVSRFLGGGEKGRYVPVEVVLSNTTNEDSFDQVKGIVDAWSFRDNNVPKGSQPILISESGTEGVKKGGEPLAKAFRDLSRRGIIPLLFRRT